MNSSKSISYLKEKGYRISRGRKAIIDVFQQTTRPLTAIEVLEALYHQDVRVNKTTVYRELTFLVSQSLLREVPVSSSIVYYESAHQQHHHHLICNNCNDIAEVDTDILEKDVEHLAKHVRKNEGFMIKDHALEFFGTCRACQAL